MSSIVLRAGAAAILAIAMGGGHAQSPADPLLGRNLAATCANCHGTNGRAAGEMKVLAGMPAADLLKKIADYRSGAQPATIMHQISKGYTDAQMQLIAAYFAAQPAPAR